jgi:hypothetical protein
LGGGLDCLQAGLKPDFPVLTTTDRKRLADLFFVKRLQTIQACFVSCQEYAFAYTRDYAADAASFLLMPNATAGGAATGADAAKRFGELIDDVGTPELRHYIKDFWALRLAGGLPSMVKCVIGARMEALGVDAKVR